MRPFVTNHKQTTFPASLRRGSVGTGAPAEGKARTFVSPVVTFREVALYEKTDSREETLIDLPISNLDDCGTF